MGDCAISNHKEGRAGVWKGNGGEKALENGLRSRKWGKKGQNPGAVRNKWLGTARQAHSGGSAAPKGWVRSLVEGQAGV